MLCTKWKTVYLLFMNVTFLFQQLISAKQQIKKSEEEVAKVNLQVRNEQYLRKEVAS